MSSFESDRGEIRRLVPARLPIGIICTLVLGGILVAGLWPFHAPKNQVRWLSNGKGLCLRKYGSLLSVGGFKTSNSSGGASLEIWLESSAMDGSGTILSFYLSKHRSTSFALRQSWDDLELQRNNFDKKRDTGSARIYTDHVFRDREPVFLTISSGERGTSIYVNGTLVRMSRNFQFTNEDLGGQLVVGNSAINTDTWSGQLRGLAIYSRELAASQVTQHYQSWLGSGHPDVSTPEGAVSLYLFNEGSGDVVHNQVDPITDLVIPDRFFVLHEPFLERPWNEYYPGWHYWTDIGINIAGFIPLGLVFYAYFSLVRGIEHATTATIVFAFAVSLTIEVLQAFLPTRNSGTTDLITNTFGAVVGATLCARSVKRNWAAHLGSVGSAIGEPRADIQLVE